MPDLETIALSAALEEDDVAFWEQLKAEIETPLDGRTESCAAHKAVLERLESHKCAPTKAHLYELDRLTLEIASDDEVRAQAPWLYCRYCRERAEAIDPNDLAMNPPGPNDSGKMIALRARMLEILRTLHWSYTFGPIRERRRKELIKLAMWVTVAATVILGASVVILRSVNQPFFAMLSAVVYAGLMGGAVSCARRLGNVSTTDDALGSIYALKNSRYVLLFAPMTGAVFAVITMLLFMAGLMVGPLFPKFTELTFAGTVSGPWQFTNALLPTTSSGYALLFLWCFIAGFAERFIPDTLDDLTKRAANQKKEAAKEPTPALH